MSEATTASDETQSTDQSTPPIEGLPTRIEVENGLQFGSAAFDLETGAVFYVVGETDTPFESVFLNLVEISTLRASAETFETFADVVEAAQADRLDCRPLPADRLAPLPVTSVPRGER